MKRRILVCISLASPDRNLYHLPLFMTVLMGNHTTPAFILAALFLLLAGAGCTLPQTSPGTASAPSLAGTSSPTGTLAADSTADNISIIRGIVEEYHATHTYSLVDEYVCAQMAQDVWDMVETRGINAVIEVGNITQKVPAISGADHAWVLADVSPPDGWIAMETTGGYLVCNDSSICALYNPLYYEGWTFATPGALQDYLKNGGCQAGYVLGSDNACHLSCGSSYCSPDQICVNGQCEGCSQGYVIGQDLQCHQACPAGSATYCTSGTCVNGQCRSCSAGYLLGSDLQCHPACPAGSDTYCSSGACGADGLCHVER